VRSERHKTLAARDAEVAMSVVNPVKERKAGRKRRCVSCGLSYSLDELFPERDSEDRVIGLICEGCY